MLIEDDFFLFKQNLYYVETNPSKK